MHSTGCRTESAPSGKCNIRNADHNEVTSSGETTENLKAPGCDGISHDFFQLQWVTIMNDLLATVEERILDCHKQGIIMCIPKTNTPTSPEDYRPLTLMNSDFKLLSRIIANRLRPWLHDLLHAIQNTVAYMATIY